MLKDGLLYRRHFIFCPFHKGNQIEPVSPVTPTSDKREKPSRRRVLPFSALLLPRRRQRARPGEARPPAVAAARIRRPLAWWARRGPGLLGRSAALAAFAGARLRRRRGGCGSGDVGWCVLGGSTAAALRRPDLTRGRRELRLASYIMAGAKMAISLLDMACWRCGGIRRPRAADLVVAFSS